MTPEQEAAGYAADVPLICDPVPGPAAPQGPTHGYQILSDQWLLTPRRLTPQQVAELRAVWLGSLAGTRSPVAKQLADDQRFRRLGPARTEWPDAEFCAA